MARYFPPVNFHYGRPVQNLMINHFPLCAGKSNSLNEEKTVTLYVSKIPYYLDEQCLRYIFTRFGEVVRLFMKRNSNSSCFGFVDYQTIMEAVIAIKEINGKPPFYLNVEFAKMGIKMKKKHGKNFLSDELNDTSLSTFNTTPIEVKTKGKNGCKQQTDNGSRVTKFSSTPISDVSRVPSLSSDTSSIVAEQSSFLPQSKNHLSKFSVATTKSETMEEYEKTLQMSKHCALALPLQENDKKSPSIKKLKKTKAKDIEWNSLSPGKCEKLNVCCVKSPDEIWVQRVQELETLCKIEDAVKTLSKENVLEDPSVNDICASLYIDNMLYRAKINKVFPNNTSEVHYIDYGNTAMTAVSDLFFLNEAVSTYPAQAILCKLGDIKPPNNAKEWNILDSKALQLLTDVSIFEANVINFTPHKYEVDLIMEDGTSVAELLVNEHNAEWISEEIYPSICVKSISNEFLNSNSTIQHIPSVLHFLKNKSKIELLPVVIQDTSFWAWVYDEYLLRSFKHVESIIKKKSIEVKDRKRRSVKKGEYAAALSPSCNKWYRCYILQAKCNKFSVRYVDYGNEEIVFQVCTLEPDHLVCSPLLYCVANRPFSSEMRKVLEEASSNMLVQGVLKCFSEEEVQVDIMNNSKIICQLKGFPWYHGLTSDKYSSAIDKAFSKQTRETSVVVNELLKSTSCHYFSQVIMKDSIEEMELSTTFRTEIKVVWWNSAKELYVQKISDEQDRNAKIEKINLYCSAQISRKYVPIEGEIVFAKFSIDNQWHRSCVLKIMPVNKCHVFFIDYGNEEEVPFENLQRLPKEFAFPRLCACISLHDIPERKITAEHIITILDHDVWSLEVVNTLSYPISVELFTSNSSLFNILFRAKLGPTEIVPFYNTKISTSAQKVSETAVPKKFLLKSKINSFNQAVIIIVHNSSSNFYVQRVEDRGNLHSMMQAINEECNNCSKTCIPAIDDIVCAKYKEDQIWYRGCVLEILEERKCKILFLDYGNTDEVTFDDVQPLNQRFICIPVFSICVSLDDVPMEFFTKEVCDMLSDHLWKIEIVDKFSSPIKVKLYDKSNSCINNHLCDKYFSLERKVNAPTLNDSKVLVSYVDKHNQIEKNMLSNLTKITLSLNHPTQVTLVWKENEKRVFVQRTFDKSDNEVLLKKLEQYCNKEGHSSYTPVKGEIVSAKCFSDKTWYRGCILEVLSENQYSVLFIDYGNTALVPKDDIRDLPQELICYPIFCVCVQLSENETASKLLIDQIYHLEVVDVVSGQYTVRFLNSDIH